MRLRRTLLGLCFVAAFIAPVKTVVEGQSASEAPAGFDNQTNGFTTQAVFDANKDAFEERETAEDGLGPVYNAQSCAELDRRRSAHGGPAGSEEKSFSDCRLPSRSGSPRDNRCSVLFMVLCPGTGVIRKRNRAICSRSRQPPTCAPIPSGSRVT